MLFVKHFGVQVVQEIELPDNSRQHFDAGVLLQFGDTE